jgi:hypothetical protein
MPAHATWRQSTNAPGLSRPANDAMWDEMRSRLRAYELQKRTTPTEPPWRTMLDLLVRPASTRSVIAIVVGGVLLLLALVGLVR